jgi:hypothetical protein
MRFETEIYVLPSTKIKKSELKRFLLLFPFVEVLFHVGYLYNVAILCCGSKCGSTVSEET